MGAETAREAYRECLAILVRLAEGARLVGDISAHTAFTQAHGEIRRAMNSAASTAVPPAPMYCAHLTGEGVCDRHTETEGCEDHACHLGSECPGPQFRAPEDGDGSARAQVVEPR